MKNYSQQKEHFLLSDGTTAYETMSAILPSFLYTFIATTVISIYLSSTNSNKLKQFFLEFIILIVPLVLTLTVFSSYTHSILICLFVVSLNLVLLLYNYKIIKKKTVTIISKNNFVTNARSTINTLSVIAILAVDFEIFPREFSKTQRYGYSLMDTGVGLYVFANGIVAPEVANKKDSISKSIRNSIPLILIGVARCILTKKVNYHVSILEYGVHWNFFITLAVTKILTSLLLNVIHVRYICINALLLMMSHEILLQSGLAHLVINNSDRSTFILANKEGLVSSLGYVGIYLFSVYFGYLLNVRNTMKKEKNINIILKFLVMSLLTLTISLTLQNYFGISRRLANTSYCFWILFIGVFMTGLFYLAEIFQLYLFRSKLTSIVISPLIYESINFNGLAFFLISNVITGLINIFVNTLFVSTVNSLIILVCYMFINCILVYLLFIKQIKLKL